MYSFEYSHSQIVCSFYEIEGMLLKNSNQGSNIMMIRAGLKKWHDENINIFEGICDVVGNISNELAAYILPLKVWLTLRSNKLAKVQAQDQKEQKNRVDLMWYFLENTHEAFDETVKKIKTLPQYDKNLDKQAVFQLIENSDIVKNTIKNKVVPALNASIQKSVKEGQMPLQTQILHGQYEIGAVLGKGGQATVFLVLDVETEMLFAAKVFDKDFSKMAEQRNSLVKEFNTTIKKLVHPSIVQPRIFSKDKVQNQYFIIMDYIEGNTLEDLLQSKNFLPVNAALPIISNISAALAHAHKNQIIHRDIKPGNIFLRTDDQAPFLGDFGLFAHNTDGAISSFVGTPFYMSPEQHQGGEISFKMDIFSLGVVIYKTFEGVHPFIGKTDAQTLYHLCHDEPRAMQRVPEEVQKIIFRCLEKDPKKRPDNAFEVATQIEKAFQSIATAHTISHIGITDITAKFLMQSSDEIIKADTELSEALRELDLESSTSGNVDPIMPSPRKDYFTLTEVASQLVLSREALCRLINLHSIDIDCINGEKVLLGDNVKKLLEKLVDKIVKPPALSKKIKPKETERKKKTPNKIERIEPRLPAPEDLNDVMKIPAKTQQPMMIALKPVISSPPVNVPIQSIFPSEVDLPGTITVLSKIDLKIIPMLLRTLPAESHKRPFVVHFEGSHQKPFEDKYCQHLIKVPNLTVVDLSQSKLSDDGLKTLSIINTIKSLSLRYCSITGQGLSYLKNTSIEKLDISYCTNIKIEDLEELLANLPTLKEILVQGSNDHHVACNLNKIEMGEQDFISLDLVPNNSSIQILKKRYPNIKFLGS